MHTSTKKWIFTKISSLILIPFMIWFIINFVSIYDQSYSKVLLFFSTQPSKILFSFFIVNGFFFFALTISEIFEDYISNEKFKNVANKFLNLFAITISLITIIGIYNLWKLNDWDTFVKWEYIAWCEWSEVYLHIKSTFISSSS